MVDAKNRERAAVLIERWLKSSVTNWDFEDEWPDSSEDRAVVDIGRELWRLYSDSPERLLNVSDLSAEELALLRRCLAFLHSKEPYEPVPYEEAAPRKANVFTELLAVKKKPWEAMRLKIDSERQKWWPFANEVQWHKITV